MNYSVLTQIHTNTRVSPQARLNTDIRVLVWWLRSNFTSAVKHLLTSLAIRFSDGKEGVGMTEICSTGEQVRLLCKIPPSHVFLQKEQQSASGDTLNKIEDWDNKMAADMLPLDQEAEAFGEKPPQAQFDKTSPEGDGDATATAEQDNKENVETTEAS